MMRSIITDQQDVERAMKSFRATITKLALRSEPMQWSFPEGTKATLDTYILATPEDKKLLVALPEAWHNRTAHLFALERKGQTLGPDVEVNIPLKHDRRISGAFVQSEDGAWLCSRGDFTAHRGRIPKARVFEVFRKWLVEVQDGNRSNHVIPVAAVSSPTLTEDITSFIEQVIELKRQSKATAAAPQDNGATSLEDYVWRDGQEFEGEKQLSKTSGVTSYVYLHGPLFKALDSYLRAWVAGKPFEVKSNQHIDAALVQEGKAVAIFEIKTSASLTSQLYSAVGQLFYYRHRYGKANSVLYLVLPEAVEPDTQLESFLKSTGITLLVKKADGFSALDGTTLQEVLERSLDA